MVVFRTECGIYSMAVFCYKNRVSAVTTRIIGLKEDNRTEEWGET